MAVTSVRSILELAPPSLHTGRGHPLNIPRPHPTVDAAGSEKCDAPRAFTAPWESALCAADSLRFRDLGLLGFLTSLPEAFPLMLIEFVLVKSLSGVVSYLGPLPLLQDFATQSIPITCPPRRKREFLRNKGHVAVTSGPLAPSTELST